MDQRKGLGASEMGERVATLEANNKNHHEWLEAVTVRLGSLDDKVGKILEALAGNRSFLNGVVFTLAALGGAIGFIASKLWDRVVGGHL